MEPYDFVRDMGWKDLCNREAVARQRYEAAEAAGEAEAPLLLEAWRRACDAVVAHEEYLRGVNRPDL